MNIDTIMNNNMLHISLVLLNGVFKDGSQKYIFLSHKCT